LVKKKKQFRKKIKIVGKQAFKEQIDLGKFENSSKNKHFRNKMWIHYR
jgi:hypothetical protein